MSSDTRTTADLIDVIAKQSQEPLSSATTLPGAAYIDADYYKVETRRVLHSDWVPAARVEQVPEVGNFVTVDIAGEALVVVRGTDDQIRVLSRVCRHRYADVLANTQGEVPESGCLDNFSCPYHMWTYRLDGSLINAVDFAGREGFDPASYGLREIKSEIWQGFVFVNLDDDSERPLGMEVLDEALGNYDFTNWRLVATSDWGNLPSNWKVAMENALEFYHHIGAHLVTLESVMPGLGTRLYDGSRGDHVYYSKCPISADAAAGEVDGYLQPTLMGLGAPEITPSERSDFIFTVRFPLLILAAAPDFSFWLQLLPTGPETHIFKVHVLAPNSTAEGTTDEHIARAVDMFQAIQGEDAAVNERVQAMFHSERAVGGVFHEQELPLLQLQRYLAGLLTEEVRG